VTPILPAHHQDKVFKKEVKRDKAQAQTGQLETPSAHPMSLNDIFAAARSTTTSGTFADAWTAITDALMHRGLALTVFYLIDASTAGEFRLVVTKVGVGSFFGPARALPAGSGEISWHWLHGVDVPYLGDVRLTIQSRRTSGAGNVNLYEPIGGIRQVHSRGCTTVGF
jgi:hypothetical protein